MECRRIEHQSVDLIDGRLAPPAELRVHAHLESCASCRESFARWQRLVPAMRGLHPEPLDPMAVRRIEVSIERALAHKPAPAESPMSWLRRLWWAPLGAGVAVAALLLVLLRPAPQAPAYGRLEQLTGRASVAGKPLAPGAVLAANTVVDLESGSQLVLVLGRASEVSMAGPARVGLLGDGRALRLRLESGSLAARVGPRQSDESFTVETPGGRVEVRGTRFTVAVTPQGSWVSVDEGRVAAFRAGGTAEEQVSASQTLWLSGGPVSEPAPAIEPAARAWPRPSCEQLATRVRSALRAGETMRAVRLAEQQPAEGKRAPGRCRDELGYLRAESLRAAGRMGDAITAYRSLDRPGAPPAMRQNALFAAAELELRAGRKKAALRDFEAAIVASPEGALREDAMARAMDTAQAAGAMARAERAARRYLSSFPDGNAAGRARQILGGAGAP